MSETLSICDQVDKALWERHRHFQRKGEECPLLTIVFNPPSYASFKHEMSKMQFMAVEIVGRVDKYRGATIGCTWKQVEPFRVVER
jgi:hypothetical protein